MTRTRRIILGIVLIFIIYAVATSPDQSADTARTMTDAVSDGVRSIFRFFDALLDG
jgi:hypothetical protein